MQKIIILLVLCLVVFSSCSKDSAEEEEVKITEECNIEAVDQGCAVAYLDGNPGWIRVSKQGNLADPQFMYPSGENDDSYGTVTIYLENGNPVISLNDLTLDDYLVRISQSSDGSDFTCKTGSNIENPESDDDNASIIEVPGNFEFPFYVQLQANVCF